jgi:hypothetical protein
MKLLNYVLTSILLFYVPITGLLIGVGVAIIFDTFTVFFKSIKLNGFSSIRSSILSNIISKMALYELCILSLFAIDYYVLNEFIIKTFGIKFMFTKICAIMLIFVELVSIKENIEQTFNVDLWKLLKNSFNRAKEIKDDVNEITK